MWILPYQRYDLGTSLSVHDAQERMRRAIHPRNTRWRFSRLRPKGYEGEVDERGFDINRIIWYRNSFLPYATGRFEAVDNNGTAIHVRIALHQGVSTFLLVVITLLGMGLVTVVVSQPTWVASARSASGILVAIVGIYAMVMIGWYLELFRIRDFVRGVLAANHDA